MSDPNATWPERLVDDLCLSIVDCVNRTAPVVLGPTPFRMLRTTNVKGGFIDAIDTRFVEEDVFKTWTRRQLPQPGDVILTREAPLGEVGIIRPGANVFLGQRLVSYRTNPDLLDNRFLLYYLRSDQGRAQVMSFGMGSTVAHMRVPDAKNLKIPVPPLEQQCSIASILGSYDDLIEVNRRRVAVLEQMARTLFESHVVKLIGVLPPPHGGQGNSILPSNWQIARLGDIAEIIMGQSPPSTQLNKAGKGFAFHQGVTDFGALFPRRRVYCTPSNKNKLAEAGDLLFSVRAPVGRINLATEQVVLGRGVSSIRSKIGSPFFLAAHLRATFHTPDLIGNGAIYKAVGRQDIENIPIALPPMELTEQINALIHPIYEALWTIQRSNDALEVSRDLLLPRLISGRLSVSTDKRDLEEAA